MFINVHGGFYAVFIKKGLKMFINVPHMVQYFALTRAHVPSCVCMHFFIVRVNEIKVMVDPLMISEPLISLPTTCDDAHVRQDMPCYYW